MAIDQIAQSGLSSLKVIYYLAQLSRPREGRQIVCAVLIQEKYRQTQHQRVCQKCLYPVKKDLTGMLHEYYRVPRFLDQGEFLWSRRCPVDPAAVW
ncbi:hypothetical protein DSA95_25560 [Salmonella enterica subsp. enterica serovar Plymouth]|uniref:Uncharacterized protein n=2 Tax=Salmonella enterica I TaxID=59201 RepID=A0A5V0BG83_SALEN|nr:hypothetical protein [Salmonella enterica subsp. enterica serovar Enteritidis]EBS5544225.1 hypothetical protein [Salmonella enterica subsp. enterica serovar Plymouth]EBW7768938.1 hypothetical protein [Salmonella enterica subsp. enterica serovar Louisiana]EBY3151890.1 hypothetical protein [Salmonella enterica subsp. enterica serovar Teshie]ECA1252938.1 hypothetical protein [Salmonella enterica subsp. enterica serovar Chailey]ECA7544139.1 hypothetical protein [Salmonella enterica subsp. enter